MCCVILGFFFCFFSSFDWINYYREKCHVFCFNKKYFMARYRSDISQPFKFLTCDHAKSRKLKLILIIKCLSVSGKSVPLQTVMTISCPIKKKYTYNGYGYKFMYIEYHHFDVQLDSKCPTIVYFLFVQWYVV